MLRTIIPYNQSKCLFIWSFCINNSTIRCSPSDPPRMWFNHEIGTTCILIFRYNVIPTKKNKSGWSLQQDMDLNVLNNIHLKSWKNTNDMVSINYHTHFTSTMLKTKKWKTSIYMIKISYQLNRLWHFGLPVKLHTTQSHPTISMTRTQK